MTDLSTYFSQSEKQIMLQCARTIVEGPFLRDTEFHPRVGVEKSAAKSILENSDIFQLANLDEPERLSRLLLIDNAMSHVCYRLDFSPEEWETYVVYSKESIIEVFKKWNTLKKSEDFFKARRIDIAHTKNLGMSHVMGPKLRAEVTRQLLQDLRHYGVTTSGLSLDWSDTCIEGHCRLYLDGEIENYSGIAIVDKDGHVVGDGWMDFAYEKAGEPLFVFWEFLSIGQTELKQQSGIPPHIWQQLPPSAQRFYMSVRMPE